MAIEAGNPYPNLPLIPPSRFITIPNHMVGLGGGTSFPAALPNPIPFPLPAPAIPSYAKEAGLTSNDITHMGSLPSSRKRPRDDSNPFPNHSTPVSFGYPSPNDDAGCGGFPSQRIRLMTSLWFEQEAALQMQRQQRDLVAQHTQRLRVELEERARQQAKALAFAIRGAVATKLREKEDEIQRAAKLNLGLLERVRSLCAENQLWRGLAQSNEAAANSLRMDLERVLSGTAGGVEDNNGNISAAARGDEEEEDAESCCGSNEEEEEVGGSVRRRCKACEGWLDESSGSESEGVVVMPCRHVFMQCKRCNWSSRQSCPVCGSKITSTLHVHLPS